MAGYKPKGKAVVVQFRDGARVLVHEPLFGDMPVFLRAMPALNKVGEYMKSLEKPKPDDDGFVPPALPAEPISDDVIEPLLPLLRIMTSPVDSDVAEDFEQLDVESLDDFRQFPFWDGIAILNALAEFVPNSTRRQETPGS